MGSQRAWPCALFLGRHWMSYGRFSLANSTSCCCQVRPSSPARVSSRLLDQEAIHRQLRKTAINMWPHVAAGMALICRSRGLGVDTSPVAIRVPGYFVQEGCCARLTAKWCVRADVSYRTANLVS